MEGSANQMDLRFLHLFPHDHFHNIEPEQDIRVIEKPQPGKCAADDQPLFLLVNRIRGVAEVHPAAGLHFHEDQRVRGLFAADDVDLASVRGAIVPIDDFVPLPLQIMRGQPLPFPSQRMRGIDRLSRTEAEPAVLAETSGDGSRKGRKRGAAEDGARCRTLCV